MRPNTQAAPFVRFCVRGCPWRIGPAIPGLLGHLAGDRFKAMSVGTEPSHVRPLAIRAMEEVGIDISGQESKTLERYLQEPFDYVITICDDANETCPCLPGTSTRLRWSFEDPSRAE